MASVTRLVTFVDIAAVSASQLSFAARHDAVLSDGRRLVLLDDRGWSQSKMYFVSEPEPSLRREHPSPWEGVTREHIEVQARWVVGPDDAYADYTQAEIDEAHFAFLSAALERQGVDVSATDLGALPHEVELSDQLLARLGETPS